MQLHARDQRPGTNTGSSRLARTVGAMVRSHFEYGLFDLDERIVRKGSTVYADMPSSISLSSGSFEERRPFESRRDMASISCGGGSRCSSTRNNPSFNLKTLIKRKCSFECTMGGSEHASYTMAAVAAGGGAMGYVKSRSMPSLIAGGIFGAIFVGSGLLIRKVSATCDAVAVRDRSSHRPTGRVGIGS